MVNEEFQWKRYPEVEEFIVNIIIEASTLSPDLKKLEEDLHEQTSTRIFDWIDSIAIHRTETLRNKLLSWEFTEVEKNQEYSIFNHFKAQFPKIILIEKNEIDIYLTAESIADFLMVRGLEKEIHGTIYSAFRKCHIFNQKNVNLFVVERRAYFSHEPKTESNEYISNYLWAVEKWKSRPRNSLEKEDQDLHKALLIAKEIVDKLGKDLAAWIVLQVERDYWQSRNSAGQMQKNRQDKLGLGWANHDHHTFRSSRKNFSKLVSLFEHLGFKCRERFYAGEEAGWGAQVMENSNCRLVLFLDVDLAPEEVMVDFAHQSLPDLQKLGTIGLWCALHGDSILSSGMHHLEAQFEFENLEIDLKLRGIGMMEPFSNFPYLKQAFTVGEHWRVNPSRVEQLIKNQKITSQEGEKFILHGALGSHLENLQRREGYKGFNKKSVNFIIKQTDPRKE